MSTLYEEFSNFHLPYSWDADYQPGGRVDILTRFERGRTYTPDKAGWNAPTNHTRKAYQI
jgi:hypothetical protein